MLFMFNKSLLLALVCIAACSTAAIAQCNVKLKIGARLPVKCLPTEDEDVDVKYVATHPSQFSPSIERLAGDVKYTIAFDTKTHQIKYIHTSDRAFLTKNGLRPGSQIKVSLKQITGGYGGWYTFAGRTPDGWDIIIANQALDDWKVGEIRKVTVSGFKKGGN